MKFKSQKFLGALVVCGCLAALRTQASFEYDFVPDNPNPSVSGSIFLDAASNPNGNISDIVSLNITFNGVNYTEANLMPDPLHLFALDWDATSIDTMILSLTGSKGLLSVTADTIGGGGSRLTGGSWNAPSVPDATNTTLLFVIAL